MQQSVTAIRLGVDKGDALPRKNTCNQRFDGLSHISCFAF
jgi:hypothetical protein